MDLVFHNQILWGGGGQYKFWGPSIFQNVCAAVGVRGKKSHTKVCFIETGGANKAPLFQGADSQHKFPFTPTVAHTERGFRRGFSANYPTDRGLLHLEPNEGIMGWSCQGGFSLFRAAHAGNKY